MTTFPTSYDVIIVGCGSAGIAAALELQQCQPVPNFLILEARDRVGGRVHTDTHTFTTKEPIDVGARWIHHYRPENPLSVHHTPSEKDIIDSDFFETIDTGFFDHDGTALSRDVLDEAKQIVEELCTSVKQYPVEKEDVSMLDVFRDKYQAITNEQMRRLVDMNLAYIEHYEASNVDQLSAKSYLKSDYDVETCDLTIPIGLGSFIEQIVERNRLPVQLNTAVTRIQIPDDKNELIDLTTQDNRHYSSKYVLITIPLGCLKARSIEFIPSLPDWKQQAIDRMGFGLLNKIYLQFPWTFWDEKCDNIFIASSRFRFYLCFPHDHILNLFVCGHVARTLESLADEEIVEQILASLQPVYPQMPKPTKWLITRWGTDPFAYGSYSNFTIGASYETVELLARKCYDGRIFWAGEHANYGGTLGCVDSAFESGHREAKRIHRQLRPPSL